MAKKTGAKRKVIELGGLINRFIGLTDEQKLDLGLAYHAGLFRIERGIGTDQDWGCLAVCLRLGMKFALKGNGSADSQLLIDAHDALMECEARFQRIGVYVFFGDELIAVRAGLTAHDKQMARTSYHTVSKLLLGMEIELHAGEAMERIAA